MILYHKSNLAYTGFFPQFLIFQQNNLGGTTIFFFKLHIVEKKPV